MKSISEELERFEEIKEEYFETIKDATTNLVDYEIITDIPYGDENRRGYSKYGFDRNGFGFYLFLKIKEGKVYRSREMCHFTYIESLKCMDFRKVIDNIKLHIKSPDECWKLTILEIIADSLDRFRVNIPWSPLVYHINKKNEIIHEKLKNDLKTILVANRL